MATCYRTYLRLPKVSRTALWKKGKNYIGSWNFGPSNINLSVLNLAKLGKKYLILNLKL